MLGQAEVRDNIQHRQRLVRLRLIHLLRGAEVKAEALLLLPIQEEVAEASVLLPEVVVAAEVVAAADAPLEDVDV